MGKDLAYVRAICFCWRYLWGRTWNGKRNRPSDLKFHSGDGARKLDSIMSHQLLLPVTDIKSGFIFRRMDRNSENSTLWVGREISDLDLYNSAPIFCSVVWLKVRLPRASPWPIPELLPAARSVPTPKRHHLEQIRGHLYTR